MDWFCTEKNICSFNIRKEKKSKLQYQEELLGHINTEQAHLLQFEYEDKM